MADKNVSIATKIVQTDGTGKVEDTNAVSPMVGTTFDNVFYEKDGHVITLAQFFENYIEFMENANFIGYYDETAYDEYSMEPVPPDNYRISFWIHDTSTGVPQ